MVFLGAGALLRSAVLFAHQKGYTVDGVYTLSHEFRNKWQELGIPYTVTQNYNDLADEIAACCTDSVVFSINNVIILKKALLSRQPLQFFNIHNGILPEYRGRPESCIFFALLNKADAYGATLHVVDEGIDTGSVIDEVRFPIGPEDTFESLMNGALLGCAQLFERNVAAILANSFTTKPATGANDQKGYPLYRLSDLRLAEQYRHHENFARATHLGIYRLWYGNLFPGV